MRGTTAVLARMNAGRFAKEQAAHRLARVVFEVQKTVRMPPDSPAIVEAVHQLRVSTRRLRAVLDTFEDAFPPKERKKVKKQIREVFQKAGAVRNIDITLELIEETKMDGLQSAEERLRLRRREEIQLLLDALRAWVRQEFSARWRDRLNLP